MDEEFDRSPFDPGRKDELKAYGKHAEQHDHEPGEDWKLEERLRFLRLLQEEGRPAC